MLPELLTIMADAKLHVCQTDKGLMGHDNSGIARTYALGHSMGTLHMCVQTCAQTAEPFRGVWGLLPQKIFTASQVGSEAIP